SVRGRGVVRVHLRGGGKRHRGRYRRDTLSVQRLVRCLSPGNDGCAQDADGDRGARGHEGSDRHVGFFALLTVGYLGRDMTSHEMSRWATNMTAPVARQNATAVR